MPNRPLIDDTFAEGFSMQATRLIITADDDELASIAANQFCGNASSVIGCDCEAGVECRVPGGETIDGRPGVAVLAFAFDRDSLQTAVTRRVGQNVLTCPTTACYSGLDSEEKKDKIKVGGQLRFFGDGFQFSKKLGDRRFWRVPVLDGEFVCDDAAGTTKAIGGGNLLLAATDPATALATARAAIAAINTVPGVITPFPSGIVRAASKVGSKYKGLPASTNDRWCPTLRGQTKSRLQGDENCVYEIVIDGLTRQAVAAAMQAGMDAAAEVDGLLRISAGNYGGKLGPHHFPLRQLHTLTNEK